MRNARTENRAYVVADSKVAFKQFSSNNNAFL